MPRVAPGTTERRPSVEVAALEAELPRVFNGCGHYGINAKALYTTSNVSTKLCVECYRERERERQRSYRGGTPGKPALRSAGHNGKRAPLDRDPEVEAALGVLRDARGARTGHQGYIYLIGEDGNERGLAVKVGFSTNPQARVAELQTGNPRPLALFATIEGTLEDEAAIHERHIGENLIGEWFRPTPALLSEFGLDIRACYLRNIPIAPPATAGHALPDHRSLNA